MGRRGSGPAFGLVRLELCHVKAFWLLFGLQKVTKGKKTLKASEFSQKVSMPEMFWHPFPLRWHPHLLPNQQSGPALVPVYVFFTPGCHPGLLKSSTTPWSILGLADSTIPVSLSHGQFNIHHSTFFIQHSTFIIHHSSFFILHSSFFILHSTFQSSSAPTSPSSPYHCAEVNGLSIFFYLGFR